MLRGRGGCAPSPRARAAGPAPAPAYGMASFSGLKAAPAAAAINAKAARRPFADKVTASLVGARAAAAAAARARWRR